MFLEKEKIEKKCREKKCGSVHSCEISSDHMVYRDRDYDYMETATVKWYQSLNFIELHIAEYELGKTNIPPDEEIYVLEYETDNDEINGIESHEESNEETDNIWYKDCLVKASITVLFRVSLSDSWISDISLLFFILLISCSSILSILLLYSILRFCISSLKLFSLYQINVKTNEETDNDEILSFLFYNQLLNYVLRDSLQNSFLWYYRRKDIELRDALRDYLANLQNKKNKNLIAKQELRDLRNSLYI